MKNIPGRKPVKSIYKESLFQPSGTDLKAPLFNVDRVQELMDGAIDIHIHSGPDAYAARVADELQLSIEACQAGMAAVVFKCHAVPTQRSVTLLQGVVNKWAEEHNRRKTDLFGGVVLNYAVGGLNPEAVFANARLGGKYVWLPSLDSAYHRREIGMREGIEVLDENDNVVPALKEIFTLIAQTDMVLGICHQTTKEKFILIDEAKKAGVKKIEVIHPLHPSYSMSIEELRMVTEKGAYIGLYSWSLAPPMFNADWNLQALKEIDPAYFVAGTDVGLFQEDRPVESMRRFITWMLVVDIPDKVVGRIVKINAKELLY